MKQLFIDTLDDYTAIVYLISDLDRIDQNYLSKQDLENFAELACNFGLENLPDYEELENLYNSDYYDLNKIYIKWRDIFEKKEENLKNELIDLFCGDDFD